MLVNISFAFDNVSNRNYGQYVTTTICQMLSRTTPNNQYNIYLIVPTDFNYDIEKNIRKINNASNGKISYLHPNYNFEKFYNGASPAIFGRLLLPNLLPEVDKIMYFDNDVFFNSDVADLFHFDISNVHIAGVKDLIGMEGKNNNIFHFHKKLVKNIFGDRKLEDGQDYVCSGVLLMNLEKMRQDNIFNKMEIIFEKNGKSVDQDILNYTCTKKFLPIEYGAFNTKMYKSFTNEFMLSKSDLMSKIKLPKILHCNYPKFGINKTHQLFIGIFMFPGITGGEFYLEGNRIKKLLFI